MTSDTVCSNDRITEVVILLQMLNPYKYVSGIERDPVDLLVVKMTMYDH